MKLWILKTFFISRQMRYFFMSNYMYSVADLEKKMTEFKNSIGSQPKWSLCAHLYEIGVKGAVCYISPTWSKFSGSSTFPVPHPELDSCDAFYKSVDNFYVGEYGQNRIELAHFIADEVLKATLLCRKFGITQLLDFME